MTPETPPSDGIAIVGMTGRFPGAADVDQFWKNLRDGASGITRFSAEELLAEGVPAELVAHPHYVKARGVLDDIAGFDAKFFGFSPREADITDPQQRLFLEACWEALEDAAYPPSTFPGAIGVFGGASWSTYFFDIYSRPEIWQSLGGFQIAIGNEKDHLATRVSYKLNLRGPALTIQTACSTSLVAVTLACQSLIARQSDLALAGGVSISIPQKRGYLYQEGGIHCPDGFCRAFDADAQGTIGGSGVGVVVLKRLADALRDGDRIRAVIRGWGINNDGARKVGYTAPSIEGQAQAIADAHAMAGLSPAHISYVEAHGTGTPLGDPIEVAALTDAFRRGTDQQQYCALGSVKTNIGHLDAAAGVAGLIKTTLALENATLPPSLHFKAPNPAIPFATSPFVVNAERRDWQAPGGAPRRAGVSSFGIGGTNAHVVLEEAPAREPSGPAREHQLLTLSAATENALDAVATRLAAHLRANLEASLADVAYTLQVGRTELAHRRTVVVRSADEAIAALERRDAAHTGIRREHPPRVVFLFPGQGSQAPGMLAGVYQAEPVYRQQVDTLLHTLEAPLAENLRSLLTDSSSTLDADQTRYAQPALFLAEYALARLWMSWGIVPDALIGHSIGEFTAAALAGVFSPGDALRLVAARGEWMQALPTGKMLAVPLGEAQLRPVLGPEIGLAAVNGAELCTLSGPADAIDRLEKELRIRGVDCRPLHTSHAFHSAAMEPLVEPFAELVSQVARHAPALPMISNTTGTWLDADDARDPAYWGRHLRGTVRFADGLATLLEDEARILLEVGPGQALATLAGRHPARHPDQLAIASGRHPQTRQPDAAALLGALGRLWVAGVPIDWPAFSQNERRQRVKLPTYPFERQRHWIEPAKAKMPAETPVAAKRPRQVVDWTYLPSWTRRPPLPGRSNGAARTWLLFADDCGCAEALAARLRESGDLATLVAPGDRFEQEGEGRYRLPPADAAAYRALLEALRQADLFPDAIAHCWGVTTTSPSFARAQELGFHSLLHLGRALAVQPLTRTLPISVVATGLFDVAGDAVDPEKATVLGPCKVIPQERSQLRCRVIDLASPDAAIDLLHEELAAEIGDTVIAHRGRHRWAQTFEAWRPPVKKAAAGRYEAARRGCWLITGGRGRIGRLIAAQLAETRQAPLVLVGRTPATGDDRTWAQTLGVELSMVVADASDAGAMRQAVDQARERFGRIEGVVHAAGLTGAYGFRPFEETDTTLASDHLRAKAESLLALEALLRDDPPERWVLISSLSAVLGGLGMAAYAGANAFLDAFAASKAQDGAAWLSIDWDGWDFTGASKRAISPEAGMATFESLLAARGISQVVVSVGDLHARLDEWIALRSIREAPAGAVGAPSPPAAAAAEGSTLAATGDPESTLERIAALWRELLGVARAEPHDNFFELGGHSLLAIQLISRLRSSFQVEVSVHLIFEKPTLAALAEHIEARRTDDEAARLEQLLSLVEGLSDDEVSALLAAQGEA